MATWDEMLAQTLEDHRLTKSERRALEERLRDAALDDCVRAVRIVTDDEKAHEVGSDVEELARAGVPVRVDDSPYHMHHEFALFDDLLLTGSYNWTRGAADSDEENLILSNDRRLLASFRGEFERLWNEFAKNRLGS